MELLKIHPITGQWTLEKRSGEFATDPGQKFQSYRSRALDGNLPEDRGQKGVLHNVGTVRAPRKQSKNKMDGKTPTPIKSAAVDRSPGLFE